MTIILSSGSTGSVLGSGYFGEWTRTVRLEMNVPEAVSGDLDLVGEFTPGSATGDTTTTVTFRVGVE